MTTTNTVGSIIARFDRLSNELVRAGLSSHSVPVHMLRYVRDLFYAYPAEREMPTDEAARLASWFAENRAVPTSAWCAMEGFLYWLLLSETPRLDSVIDEARDIIAACEL